MSVATAHWTDQLVAITACRDSIKWCRKQPDPETAWKLCPRGDWMLYWAWRTIGPPGDESRKPFVLASCRCARLGLPYVLYGDERPRVAIEKAEAWTRGEATLDEVREAVYNADFCTGAYAAAASVYCANYDDSANAAAAAATAVFDYYYSYARYYAAHSNRMSTLRKCADIVREYYPHIPMVK